MHKSGIVANMPVQGMGNTFWLTVELPRRMRYTDYYVLLKRHFPTYHRFMHALAARYALGSETDADLELMTTEREIYRYYTAEPSLTAEEVEKIKLMGLFAREQNG